ncbi:MAG: DegT/DnrJ/EryC1/StrS family aminotransferase, partial [Anaerolineae bacterium]
MSRYDIPFNRPCLVGSELVYVAQAIANGHISGDGLFTRKCHTLLERALDVPKVLLTTSCTHALELAALLLNIHSDSEVIVPSFTFVTTANAFVLRGARPVFVDIRPDTLNMDEGLLEGMITD